MIHYLQNKVGVVDFAKAQGLVNFTTPTLLHYIKAELLQLNLIHLFARELFLMKKLEIKN